MFTENNNSSVPYLAFSEKDLRDRFKGSPFKGNVIELEIERPLQKIDVWDRFYLLSMKYPPGLMSAYCMLYGFYQRNYDLVGAGLLGLMAELSMNNCMPISSTTETEAG